MEFTEDLLHYVWKSRMLWVFSLTTTSGEPIKIIHAGLHNTHSGPDFENALLNIGDTRWAGNVEMHLKSSDWHKHQHENDPAYENVILHVVFKHDQAVFRSDGTEIPVLELKNTIPLKLINTYRDLIKSSHWIPCAAALPKVEPFYVNTWLNRVLIERLEDKSAQVETLVNEQKGSWDDAFYITLARNFGFKNNALPFECLARSLPQTLLARYKNQSLKIEALIFGQAGFLAQTYQDDYPNILKKEYEFLQKKHDLMPLDASLWKFMRLRPANFPTIRLAQFAALAIKSNHLFAQILEIEDIRKLRLLFSDLPINVYWENRFRFDKPAEEKGKQPGDFSLDNLLVNSIAVFLFAYGLNQDREHLRHRALHLLEHLPPEKNQIVAGFTALKVAHSHAGDTQSLLQLKKYYCDQKKCLSCGIGTQILSSSYS